MKLIKPSFKILTPTNGYDILQKIEEAGRTCYKSEENIDDDSAPKFVEMIIDRGHESVLEHQVMSVRIICDRGVSHELVRHRIASFSQESTRYCNYSKDKFDSQITFIIPCWIEDEEIIPGEYNESWFCYWNVPFSADQSWFCAMKDHEKQYLGLIDKGWNPQQARSVLPNSLKTEIVITANLREWRLIFKQRTSVKAHPQMREIMLPLLENFKTLIPIVFDNIK